LEESQQARRDELVKALGSNERKDLLATLVKMAFELVPGGGALAELVDYGMAEMKEKRLREFLAQLKIDLDDLQVTLNEDYVKTAEFAFLFEHTLRGVSQNYQKEKLDAYRALLVNSLIRLNVESERKEYFLNLVNSLTVSHLIFLRVLVNPIKWASVRRLEFKQPTTEYGPTPVTTLRLLLPKYQDSQIIAVMSDLYYNGLSSLTPNHLAGVHGPDLNSITGRLTSLGHEFLNFIILETKAVS
jgi:hypothetical protein